MSALRVRIEKQEMEIRTKREVGRCLPPQDNPKDVEETSQASSLSEVTPTCDGEADTISWESHQMSSVEVGTIEVRH